MIVSQQPRFVLITKTLNNVDIAKKENVNGVPINVSQLLVMSLQLRIQIKNARIIHITALSIIHQMIVFQLRILVICSLLRLNVLTVEKANVFGIIRETTIRGHVQILLVQILLFKLLNKIVRIIIRIVPSIQWVMLVFKCWRIALHTIRHNVNGVEVKDNVFGMLGKIMEMGDVSRPIVQMLPKDSLITIYPYVKE